MATKVARVSSTFRRNPVNRRFSCLPHESGHSFPVPRRSVRRICLRHQRYRRTSAARAPAHDAGWRFAIGHPYDKARDFYHETGKFSYVTKAGYADGPAAAAFEDRGWRRLDLPHDWAVEAPYDAKASASHGYKASGRDVPERSIGWYRKTFAIPASDLGRRISVEFDGVFRDSIVWVNGFYLGRHACGYTGFRYDLTDYLNYGGDNVIAVRVDATMEEGWFYEGAGIYRHVWLVKTAPLHVPQWGTYVTTEVGEAAASITACTTVDNEGVEAAAFEIEQNIVDPDGRVVATGAVHSLSLAAGATGEYPCALDVPHPRLWSLESPVLHRLVTTIRVGGAIGDRYETPSASAAFFSTPIVVSSSTAGTWRSMAPIITRTTPAWAWRCPTRCRLSASPASRTLE